MTRKYEISCDWCNDEYDDTEADGDEEEYWRRFFGQGWIITHDSPDSTKEFCGTDCVVSAYTRE